MGHSTSPHKTTGHKTTGEVLDLEERTWLARHLRGDAGAFDALLSAYQGTIYSYLIRCGITESAREDLFQDIFLKIHASAASYQSTQPLKPWIFTIAANTVRNYLRAQRSSILTASENAPDPIDPQPTAEMHTAQNHQLDWLEQTIATLPLKQREVLLLVTVEGLSQHEAANCLKIPLNSVKTYLRRARLTLLQALQKHERGQGGHHESL